MSSIKRISTSLAALVFAFLLIGGSKAYAADVRGLMNSQTLTPTYTGYQPCDQKAAEILAAITTPEMDTYDKVATCYNYIVNNYAYDMNPQAFQIPYDAYVNGNYGAFLAKTFFDRGVGVCDDYSCAFAALVRQIGLNCYCCSGQVVSSNGNASGHTWCQMNLGGVILNFDPDLDDVLANGGKANTAGAGANQFYYFGKTAEEDPGRYVFAGYYYPDFRPMY